MDIIKNIITIEIIFKKSFKIKNMCSIILGGFKSKIKI
jgi:hypothetical protein